MGSFLGDADYIARSAAGAAQTAANAAQTAASAAQTAANAAQTAANAAQATASAAVPDDSGNLGIGSIQLMQQSGATAIAPGATVAGSVLKNIYFTITSGIALGGGSASGTWRNVSGISASQSYVCAFQRIA